MSESRKKMDEALKKIVVPILREKGFKGSYPHFKRSNGKYVDLLSFMFSMYGEQFVVEIAKCSPKGIKYADGTITPYEKLNTWKVPDRPRLSPTMEGDYWFNYEGNSSGKDIYETVAYEVASLLNNQAEQWWSKEENVSKYSL